MPVTFGGVPKPAIRLDPVIKPEGNGWSNYGPRNVLLGFVYHNVLGRARYTGDYFRNPNERHGYNALTDWGVCNQIDGADWDGAILQWNDPDSHKSPWASGDSRPDSGDGPAMQALCSRLGLNLNQATEAIEISRLRNGDPVSTKCMASLINLTAWRADAKAKVSYETWPKNRYGVQMTLTHAEFGKVECNAGDVIAEVIEGVHDRLKLYQSQGEPVPPPGAVYPKPIAPPPFTGKDVKIGAVTFYACKRIVTAAQDGLLAVRYASRNATPVRKPIGKGETFGVVYVGEVNGAWWWITESGARVPVSGTTPKVTVTP